MEADKKIFVFILYDYLFTYCTITFSNQLCFLQGLSMLLLNQKMTSTQAWEKGLVMEVFKPDNFLEQVDNRVKVMAAMSNKVNT